MIAPYSTRVNCGVAALDAVLGYMITQAESKGISVNTHCCSG